MDYKGGRFTLTINGRRYSGRGSARIRPARATPDAGVNWDGSGYGTVAPQLAELDLSFDRGPKTQRVRWQENVLLQEVDVTFHETDANVRHYFVNGRWVGRPEINTENGEVTGMSIRSDNYKSAI